MDLAVSRIRRRLAQPMQGASRRNQRAVDDRWTDVGRAAKVRGLRPDQPGDRHVDTLPDFPRARSALAGDQSLDLQSAGRSIRLDQHRSRERGESDLERKLLDRVGSYGRQLGHIGDALEVILKHVKLGDLKPDEQDALEILKGQLASVRQVKATRDASAQPSPSVETQTRPR